MDIKVISSDIDGARLRKEKRDAQYHIRCDGKHDEAEVNDALKSSQRGMAICIADRDWERIFGRK